MINAWGNKTRKVPKQKTNKRENQKRRAFRTRSACCAGLAASLFYRLLFSFFSHPFPFRKKRSFSSNNIQLLEKKRRAFRTSSACCAGGAAPSIPLREGAMGGGAWGRTIGQKRWSPSIFSLGEMSSQEVQG